MAPKRVLNCVLGTLPIEEQTALATASGMLTIVGNEKDANDPNHSIVEIQEDGSGLRFGVMHVSKVPDQVQVGRKVSAGAPVGKPSCEVPKGGKTTGVHLHQYVKDRNGNYLPINGFTFSGWTIQGDTMTKGSEKRVADQRRCNTDQACGGIRNDFLNIGAVLGESVKAPPLPTAAAKLAPAEAKPAPGFSTHKSIILPYQIDYPSNWQVRNSSDPKKPNNKSESYIPVPFTNEYVDVLGEKINYWVTSEDYRDNLINRVKAATAAGYIGPNISSRIVAGKDGWMIEYYSKYGSSMTVVFTDRGWGWQIGLNVGKSNFTNQQISIFNQMIDSMKLR